MGAPRVLIADRGKASLVMTSEAIKDKLPGAVVLVADSGKEAIEILRKSQLDFCVVDFDLPDTDGVTLIRLMRQLFSGPIFLTAFPDAVVEEATKKELYGFADAGAWLSKPVNIDLLYQKIDDFMIGKRRLESRIPTRLPTTVIPKVVGKSKKVAKVDGHLEDLSWGGAKVSFNGKASVKKGDEISMSLSLPIPKAQARSRATTTSTAAPETKEVKVKSTVAWVDLETKKIGIQFVKLTEMQKKGVDQLMRDGFSQSKSNNKQKS